MSDVADRIDELRANIESYEAALTALPSGDRPALAAAIATTRASIETGQVPDPEAAALGQAWESLHQRLVGLESRIEAGGGSTEAVAVRLEIARAGVRTAEDLAVPRPIRADEKDELDTLREEMLDAERRAGHGLRRSAGRAAFEKAEAALQKALDPLGYPTWAAFRMGNGLVSVSDKAVAGYRSSLTELEAAEFELAELMARLERDAELQDVLLAIDRALDHAGELLGRDPFSESSRDDWSTVTEQLQAITVDAASVGVSRDAAITHLRRALGAASAPGYEDLTSDAAIVALGDSWLEVLGSADEAAVRNLRDRERSAEELLALEELGDGMRVDRLDQQRQTVRTAEQDVVRSREALTEVVRVRLRLHALATTELVLAEEHDDLLGQRESALVLVDLAERRLNGTENGAAAFAGRVPRGIGGPIPVVVVMGGAAAPMLDRLVALPDDVQIVVIGDTEGFEDWLAGVGDDVAAVVNVETLV